MRRVLFVSSGRLVRTFVPDLTSKNFLIAMPSGDAAGRHQVS
jgi:hypothetical protein